MLCTLLPLPELLLMINESQSISSGIKPGSLAGSQTFDFQTEAIPDQVEPLDTH